MSTKTRLDIERTPAALGETARAAEAFAPQFTAFMNKGAGTAGVAFVGCGTSFAVANVGASLAAARDIRTRALHASECRGTEAAMFVAVSRTGQTTELLGAAQRIRSAGGSILAVAGDPHAPLCELADAVLNLETAVESAVIQTTFVSSALLAFRMLLEPNTQIESVLRDVRASLTEEPVNLQSHDDVVVLGRGSRFGIAMAASLNLVETALCSTHCYQTLDFRHGPIAAVTPRTLVWCVDDVSDPTATRVVQDAAQAGTAVRMAELDPLAELVRVQLSAEATAQHRGINPDAPPHLHRAVQLDEVPALPA
jgi:fructoselysine-6-P-deglycase FrlB-like protein